MHLIPNIHLLHLVVVIIALILAADVGNANVLRSTDTRDNESLLFLLDADELHSFKKNESTNSRIIGGLPTEKSRFNYVVALYPRRPCTFDLPSCGGTLIKENLVVSAAHCQGLRFARVGCHDFSEPDETCRTIQVVEEIVHPDYFTTNVPHHDIMILELAESTSISPIPFILSSDLIQEEEFYSNADKDLTVLGWGNTIPGITSQSSTLLEANVEYVAYKECKDQYHSRFPNILYDYMLCAASSGKDACQGDSGGPLVLRCDSNNQDVLIG